MSNSNYYNNIRRTDLELGILQTAFDSATSNASANCLVQTDGNGSFSANVLSAQAVVAPNITSSQTFAGNVMTARSVTSQNITAAQCVTSNMVTTLVVNAATSVSSNVFVANIMSSNIMVCSQAFTGNVVSTQNLSSNIVNVSNILTIGHALQVSTGNAGTGLATPANVSGFINATINGNAVVIPYYRV